MQPSDPYGLVGQVLDGQFRVDQPIGEGGFSVVYRGRHLGLGEPIAIKCLKLPPRLGSAIVENFVRRFRDESKIQYKLSQASLHVARTIAAGTAMAPSVNALVPFMVLEWLEGQPLSEELRARRARGESGRPLPDIFRLLDPVADALAIAHGMGVVHRDLNPSNIFLSKDASGNLRPKVMDFGVAKVVSDHALALGPRTATLNQLRLFTPPYGAPEQFDDRVGPIGTWTDVYSFALVLVELLTDKAPNEGEHLLELMAHACDAANRPTPQARGALVSSAVEQLFASALSVDPTRRPIDVGEFWGRLKHASHNSSPARPTGSHTAKGTFILAEAPPAISAALSSPPTTPPAFALPLTKPAQNQPQPPGPPLPASSWHSPPVLPPMNDADTWNSPPAPPPNGEGRQPPGVTGPSNTWGASGTWAAGPPTVKDQQPPTSLAPEPSISPLADSGPTNSPSSYVDPFGPTAEGNEGVDPRPGASPLSITVKPGEKRDFFSPISSPKRPPAHTPGAGSHAAASHGPGAQPPRHAAPTPNAGVPPHLPARTPNAGMPHMPAHTPGAGVQPYAPTPAGGILPSSASSAPPEPKFAPPPTPQPFSNNASAYAPPPFPPPRDLYNRDPSGNTPYPPVRASGPPQYAPPPGHQYGPPVAVADLPAGGSVGRISHSAGKGRVPLPVHDPAAIAPPLAPHNAGHTALAPTEPSRRKRGIKPLLAWLALAVTLLIAMAGIAYLVAHYVRHLLPGSRSGSNQPARCGASPTLVTSVGSSTRLVRTRARTALTRFSL